MCRAHKHISVIRRLKKWNSKFKALHTCATMAGMRRERLAIKEETAKTRIALTKTKPTLQTLGMSHSLHTADTPPLTEQLPDCPSIIITNKSTVR